jgi:hypothetical protein
MIEASGFRAVRPKSKTLSSVPKLLAVICGIGGILLIAGLATDRPTTVIDSRTIDFGALMFIIGGLGFVYLWLWRSNVRLLIGPDQVGYQDIFRRRHYWLKGQIDRAVDMIVIYTKSAEPLRGVYLLAGDGKRMLALNTRAWASDDVRAFVEASGATLDYREQPVTGAEARRQFPKAFGWGTQHVMLGTILTMILAVVVAIAVFTLWMALSRG